MSMKRARKKLIYIIGGSVMAGSLMFGLVTDVTDSQITVSREGAGGVAVAIVDTREATITEGLGVGAAPSDVAVGDRVAVIS